MSARIGFVKGLPAHPTEIPEWMEYAWLESSVKAPRFARISDATDWADLASWPTGRLFGFRGEYRWRRIEGGAAQRLHAVLLVEDEELPAAFQGRLEIERLAEEDLVLWGEWVDDPGSDPQGRADLLCQRDPQAPRLSAGVDRPPGAERDAAPYHPPLSGARGAARRVRTLHGLPYEGTRYGMTAMPGTINPYTSCRWVPRDRSVRRIPA